MTTNWHTYIIGYTTIVLLVYFIIDKKNHFIFFYTWISNLKYFFISDYKLLKTIKIDSLNTNSLRNKKPHLYLQKNKYVF